MVTAVGTEETPPAAPEQRCSCCERLGVPVRVALLCHPEIALCDRCLLWLNGRRLMHAGDGLIGRLRVRLLLRRLGSAFRR
jgi:hypothetical protein